MRPHDASDAGLTYDRLRRTGAGKGAPEQISGDEEEKEEEDTLELSSSEGSQYDIYTLAADIDEEDDADE